MVLQEGSRVAFFFFRLTNKPTLYIIFYCFIYAFMLHEEWGITAFREDYNHQKGRFLDRVLISPKTEKALAAAVTMLMAPMALEACRDKREDSESSENIRSQISTARFAFFFFVLFFFFFYRSAFQQFDPTSEPCAFCQEET